jgi:soluble lytic murein transglycosylase
LTFTAAGLGCLAVFAGACGGGSTRPTDPPASATPTASPEPAASGIDLQRAAQLYEEGAVEEAAEIYENAIDEGNSDQRQEALWALARVQYQQGDNDKAEEIIDEYLEEEIQPDAARLGMLLKGMVQFAQGRNEEAEKSLQGYVAGGGAAKAYAMLRLADLRARRGDREGAIAQTNAALAEPLPPGVQTDARFALAKYYEDAGNPAAALDVYELLGLEGEFRVERADALWRAAQLAFTSGDAERALGSLRSLLTVYPEQDQALEAVSDERFLPHIGLPSRAIVLFQHRINSQAAEAYQAIVDSGDVALAADAHYHLGILGERASNYSEALAQYDSAISAASANGDTPTVGQALWDRGTVLELLGRTDEAVQTYVSVIDAAPSSVRASEALFRGGLLRYRQGLAAEAAAIWGRQRGLAADVESRARNFFWAGKAARAAGDEASALTWFQEAAALPELDYYVLRARAIVAGGESPADPGEIMAAAPDWGGVEDWLRLRFGPEDPVTRTAFFTSASYRRASELLVAGLRADAEREFEQLVEDAGSNGWLLYRLSRELAEHRLYALGARAALRFAPVQADTPPAVLAMAYPAVFPQVVTQQASEHGVSPYLLLGLVRQESFYDPRAISIADAMGLTQVIPSTALGIAEQLEEEDFSNSDLFRPRVSLRFGAYYLGEQIEGLGGDIPAALSAYNGGPGNAAEWQETGGGDPDVFLESIEFSETRAYVELVLEHYATYRYAYGVTVAPALPL